MDSERRPSSACLVARPGVRRSVAAAASTIGAAMIAALSMSCSRDEPVRETSALLAESARAFNRAAAQPADPAAPASSDDWVRLGQRYRIERRFAECAAAFGEAVRAVPGDADSWADLADCRAASRGHDLAASRDEIGRALSIDPWHRKALWLRASLELQDGNYASAAATWRQLQDLLQPGSPDARIVAANIVEADLLAGSQPMVQRWPQ